MQTLKIHTTVVVVVVLLVAAQAHLMVDKHIEDHLETIW
jgi:hypothetical protein